MCMCVCVCACARLCVHDRASGAVLVMLRLPVSGWVYFWISDSVSMAADASERKALRYKQTLVSVLFFIYLFFLTPSQSFTISTSTFTYLSHCVSSFFFQNHISLVTHLQDQKDLHLHGW